MSAHYSSTPAGTDASNMPARTNVRKMRWLRGAAALVLTTALTGCTYLAVTFAPEKTALPSNSAMAEDARNQLRAALYAHRYEDLPAATEALTRAYLDNPRDPDTTLMLALAHLWNVSERKRLSQPPARITDSLILAEKYFLEAKRLRPDDGRIDGWLASVRAGIARVHQDEKLQRAAYYALKASAHTYPEFNEFVVGFVLSNLPPKDPRFAEAVEAFWRNVDICFGVKSSRTDLDIRPFLKLATQTGPKRVCWNTAKVPHNLEGFLLAMGDALVKNGQPEIAKKVYGNIRHVPAFATWQYQSVLEERIRTADEWSRIFRTEPDVAKHPEQLRGSAISCTVCHGT